MKFHFVQLPRAGGGSRRRERAASLLLLGNPDNNSAGDAWKLLLQVFVPDSSTPIVRFPPRPRWSQETPSGPWGTLLPLLAGEGAWQPGPGRTRSSVPSRGFSWSPGSAVASAQQPRPQPGRAQVPAGRDWKARLGVRGLLGRSPAGAVAHGELPSSNHLQPLPRCRTMGGPAWRQQATSSEDALGHWKVVWKSLPVLSLSLGCTLGPWAPAAPRTGTWVPGNLVPGWPHSFRGGSQEPRSHGGSVSGPRRPRWVQAPLSSLTAPKGPERHRIPETQMCLLRSDAVF